MFNNDLVCKPINSWVYGPGVKRPVICYKCGRTGHNGSNCTYKK